MIDNRVESVGGGFGGYGGFGGFGGFGGGLIDGIVLAALLGGRNGGLFGNGNDAAALATNQFELGKAIGTNATKDDIFSQTQSINSTTITGGNQILSAINNETDRLANISRSGSEQVLASIYGVSGLVKDSSYSAQSNFAALSRQISEGLCATNANITSNTQRVIDTMSSQTIQALRDEVQALKTQNDFNSRGFFPATGPTMSIISPNPCADNHTKEQINIINNNVNAIGSTVQQLAAVVSSMVK